MASHLDANISSNVKEALESARYDKKLEREKSFIWKRGKELKTFRIPGDDVKRPLRYISSQEITLATLYLIEDQFGIMREQIPQAIARVFEITRTDPDENDRIREIVDELIEKEQLVLNGNRVNLA